MKGKNFYILFAAVAIALIFLYAGSFLSVGEKMPDLHTETNNSDEKTGHIKPSKYVSKTYVEYIHSIKRVNGLRQEINILEINLRDNRIKIRPVLSFGKIFGFEKLSEIAERENAYAAINSGFFHEYGEPGGMVIVDGELVTNSSGRYPVFIIRDNQALLRELHTKLWIEYRDKKLYINNINSSGNQGDVVLYTPAYGLKNRAKTTNITAAIENGRVTGINRYLGEAPIPQSGMLITFFTENLEEVPLHKNDNIEFKYDCGVNNISQGYECGSWVVKNGKVVIGNKDAWIGVTTNRDPRTVVGLKDEYTVVLLTVDGRQPGYSEGVTGKELGHILLDMGIKDAAMLDGGASTEMIVRDEIVNRPSYKGLERPLGGALVVHYDK